MDDFDRYYEEASNAQKSEKKEKKLKPLDARRNRNIDIPFLLLTIVILTIGVLTVLSASYARSYYSGNNPARVFLRQLFFAVSGIVIMLFMSKLRMSFIRKWSFRLYALSTFMLVLVLVIGIVGGGSRRWINLGITTFQPSEIAKLAIILYFADRICRTKDMRSFRFGILPYIVFLGIIVVLLLLEPHLSGAIIIISVAVVLMIVGGMNLKWFFAVAAAVIAVGIVFITTFDYAQDRLSAWLHPELDPLDTGFQVLQSLYAIGSGGLTGLGIGKSRQKFLYLPEEHNDYIFSIFCEEMGFIGAILVLLLFALLITRGFWIALHARDKYSSLVATGISTLLAVQVFLNVAVVTNLIPSTGISLPFFSYGGTALWLELAEMGIILSISREIPIEKAVE